MVQEMRPVAASDELVMGETVKLSPNLQKQDCLEAIMIQDIISVLLHVLDGNARATQLRERVGGVEIRPFVVERVYKQDTGGISGVGSSVNVRNQLIAKLK